MDEVKKLISSLLISSPLETTVRKLDMDYCDQIGERIPFREFGFTSLELFLRSIPDILDVQGTGPNAVVNVRVSNKAAHINKMVSLQRPPKQFGSRPRPRRRRCNSVQQHNSYASPIPFNVEAYHPAPLYFEYFPRFPQPWHMPQPLPPRHLPPDHISPRYRQAPPSPFTPNCSTSIPPLLTKSTNQNWPRSQLSPIESLESPHSSENNKTKLSTSLPSISSSCNSSNRKEDLKLPSSESRDDENFKGDQCCSLSMENSHNYNVPKRVQENLQMLIAKYDEGIWCGKLPEIYSKMFNKELDYLEYGYRSLIQMCLDLQKIFHCHRPDHGDFLLFDKCKPLPEDVIKNFQTSSVKTTVEQELFTEPALGNLEDLMVVPDDVYPSGVMQLGEDIPRRFIPDGVKETDYIDVSVGEVYDLSKFWLLLKDDQVELNNLMDDLQYFYTSVENNLEIPFHMIKKGLYCAAKYASEYHRAVIVTVVPDVNKVKVFYPDYGTIANIDSQGLCFLHRKFMTLPLQAIRARLASIWPPVKYTMWSVEASTRFLDLVRQKVLVAQIFRIDSQEQILEVILCDTSTQKDIFMNDTLVNEGYAFFVKQVTDSTRTDVVNSPKLSIEVNAAKADVNSLKCHDVNVNKTNGFCETARYLNTENNVNGETSNRLKSHVELLQAAKAARNVLDDSVNENISKESHDKHPETRSEIIVRHFKRLSTK